MPQLGPKMAFAISHLTGFSSSFKGLPQQQHGKVSSLLAALLPRGPRGPAPGSCFSASFSLALDCLSGLEPLGPDPLAWTSCLHTLSMMDLPHTDPWTSHL